MAHISDVVKFFTVTGDGELTPITINNYSELDATAVYIVVYEKVRKIFIWKGENAPVRTKFISAKTAQTMRQKDYGMVFRIESLDPGLEGNDFLSLVGGGPPPVQEGDPIEARDMESSPTEMRSASSTVVSTIDKPKPVKTAPTRAPSRASTSPARAPTVQKPVRVEPKPVVKPKPVVRSEPVTTSSTPSPTPKPAPKPAAAVHRQTRETEVVVAGGMEEAVTHTIEEVAAKLKALEIPEEMEREIVIIGRTVYSVIREKLRLFGKEVLKLEPMEDLPTGSFPASDYQTRLFIDDNGKVLFIEFLRKKTKSEREEFIDDIKKSLKDLTSLGI